MVAHTIFAVLLMKRYLDGLLEDDQHVNFCLVDLAFLEDLTGVVPKVMVFFQDSPYFVCLFGLSY